MGGVLNLSLAERLLYSTVKIDTSVGSRGTGFFVRFPVDDERGVVLLITNKHVVKGASSVTVRCHLADGSKPSGDLMPCTVHLDGNSLIDHPSPEVDLCGVYFGSILKMAEDDGRPIFYQHLSPEIIPKEAEWEQFDAIENVTMIGCPRGITDEFNNLPIVRRGITASSLAKRYNGKNEFLVDMACFPGSSGSPIFIYDSSGYYDKVNNTNNIGKVRLMLVGILWGGPIIDNNGRIVFSNDPQIVVASMMHLGFAIRATELLAFDGEIRKRLREAEQECENSSGD